MKSVSWYFFYLYCSNWSWFQQNWHRKCNRFAVANQGVFSFWIVRQCAHYLQNTRDVTRVDGEDMSIAFLPAIAYVIDANLMSFTEEIRGSLRFKVWLATPSMRCVNFEVKILGTWQCLRHLQVFVRPRHVRSTWDSVDLHNTEYDVNLLLQLGI